MSSCRAEASPGQPPLSNQLVTEDTLLEVAEVEDHDDADDKETEAFSTAKLKFSAWKRFRNYLRKKTRSSSEQTPRVENLDQDRLLDALLAVV